MKELTNFPKIYCPFVRKDYDVNMDDWKIHGNQLQLRSPKVYLVTTEINKGYEWVFDDPHTFCCEKLDGTNVKLYTKNGRLLSVYNRNNPIDILDLSSGKGRTAIVEGIFRAVTKGYIEDHGEQAGEVIGKNIGQNIYGLKNRIWYPFEKAIKHLRYDSFHKHDRTFNNWSSWFKDYLYSRFSGKRGDKIFAEGIIFYNLKRKEEGKIYRAKLRRDMYSWYYSDKIEIYNYGG